MSTADLERLVAQKTPLPGLWQHVLGTASGMSLKYLSAAFSRFLMTPDLVTISEIEKLQVALQVCSFYNELNNEETAQNVVSLLIDNATRHQECLEFISFLTSVAASSKCRLYLQTFGIQATQTSVTNPVCQKILSDNCLNSKCYTELYPIAKIAPQFIILLLRYALEELITSVTHQGSVNPCVLELALNLVEQNEVLLCHTDILQSTLFCVIVTPILTHKSSDTRRKQGDFEKLGDKLFKTIFLRLSSNDATVDWDNIKQMAAYIGTSKFKGQKLIEQSKERINQIILLLSHNKAPCSDKDVIVSLIQDTEFGEFLQQSLTAT